MSCIGGFKPGCAVLVTGRFVPYGTPRGVSSSTPSRLCGRQATFGTMVGFELGSGARVYTPRLITVAVGVGVGLQPPP